MLNFEYDTGHERLREELKGRAKDDLSSFARQAEDEGGVPQGARKILESLALPGADGFVSGIDDPVALCLAAEALAGADAGIAYAWLASRQVAWVIASCGTEEQKARWLPRFAESPVLPASLYMLEGRGFGPAELETEIRAAGNHLIVNGVKAPVMYPQDACVSVIVGKDDRGELTAVIAESVVEAATFRGIGVGRLAMSACPSALEARIKDLELPADSLLKTEGLHRALTTCRIAHASVCVGVATAATRYAGFYARERMAFGKPIIAFQGVSFPLIDLLLEGDAAHISALQLLTDKEMTDQQRERRANAIIAHANQLVIDAGREAIQVMGVAGVTTEHPQERAYRSAGVLASLDFDPLTTELILR